MTQVRVNGASLEYRIDGPDAAPVMTLAHSLALSLGMWDAVVPLLSQHYRILRYDSRGHGRSELGGGELTLATLVADAVGLLDALGIGKTHFVGLSMGGMGGLGLALDHADRLHSAAICDARGVATPAYRDSWSQRIAAVRQGGLAAVADSTVERWFTPGFVATHPTEIAAMKAMIRDTPADGYCASAAALRDLDYARRLAGVRVPLLFMVGAQDAGAPPEAMRAMQHDTPGARYVEIPEAGHISAVEQPQAFAEALLGFVGALG